MTATLRLVALSRNYPGPVAAVDAVDLTVAQGELLAVVGPSGSGKSTLLRLVAGLDSPTSGEVWMAGRRVDDLPPVRRGVGMVFQNPALYPHLDVFGNLAFGLRAQRLGRSEVRGRVEEVASWLRLSDLLARRPEQLSGGERQRVALGRAVVRRPVLLLLDEPFSSLDAPLRRELRDELVRLHRRLGTTTLFVTHDQAEALAIGDRMAVLDHGRLLQVDVPRLVYARPACREVGRFIGDPPMDFLPARVTVQDEELELVLGERAVRPVGGRLGERLRDFAIAGVELEVGVRPEWIRTDRGGTRSDELALPGVVERVELQGHWRLARVSAWPSGGLLSVRIPVDAEPAPGTVMGLRIDLDRACWYDRATGLLLT